ncbi:hypothetical protein VEZ01S_54_00160 [Vibrio ezurae NBRC 102218]|uniref:Uncharacterized protein n=1 Tax=Vibrio ezurae NBRC 102218 TaxID=1219080 RepID=U3B5R2_9VIBR|nr:hypothetical protein VEZ01S_54_00160 [Vibrio ezurae NBRC 102218]
MWASFYIEIREKSNPTCDTKCRHTMILTKTMQIMSEIENSRSAAFNRSEPQNKFIQETHLTTPSILTISGKLFANELLN